MFILWADAIRLLKCMLMQIACNYFLLTKELPNALAGSSTHKKHACLQPRCFFTCVACKPLLPDRHANHCFQIQAVKWEWHRLAGKHLLKHICVAQSQHIIAAHRDVETRQNTVLSKMLTGACSRACSRLIPIEGGVSAATKPCP